MKGVGWQVGWEELREGLLLGGIMLSEEETRRVVEVRDPRKHVFCMDGQVLCVCLVCVKNIYVPYLWVHGV